MYRAIVIEGARIGKGEAKLVVCIYGYHMIRWTQSGMNYWAVSDVSETDLRQFVGLVRGTA